MQQYEKKLEIRKANPFGIGIEEPKIEPVNMHSLSHSEKFTVMLPWIVKTRIR